MTLKQCIFTKNDCYKKNTKMTGNKPTGIVVHSTGCNNKKLKRYVQPALDDPNYKTLITDLGKNVYNNDWNRPGLELSVHAFIGVNDKNQVETIQTLPFDVCCWGCAAAPYDKNGNKLYSSKDPKFDHYGPSYNYNPQARIQFEICEDDLTDKSYFEKVFKEAAEFCAYLCKKYAITTKDICSHYEGYQAGYASNHGDCDHWLKKFGRDMDWFRAEVDQILKEDKKSSNGAMSVTNGLTYYVQAGAFLSLKNATNLFKELKTAGFLAQIKKYLGFYKVQIGSYKDRSDALKMASKLNAKGFKTTITTIGGALISATEEDIRIGDKIRIKSGVTKYTNGVRMLSFVKTATLYVRDIEKNGTVYLVSTLPTGKIYTGRVYAADVYKI